LDSHVSSARLILLAVVGPGNAEFLISRAYFSIEAGIHLECKFGMQRDDVREVNSKLALVG